MRTEQLSDFLYDVRYEDLPASAVNSAKMFVEDVLGAALAGSERCQGQLWRSYFCSYRHVGRGKNGAVAWNSELTRLPCDSAAALNAACAHAIDMDDVHNASIVHLGAVTIPAAVAVGQELHRSGKEVIAAIAAGYEIGARVGEAINPGSYHYWHTTGVVGALCSAAAAAKLMRLDRKAHLYAIGSAGTQAAGLWQFLEDGAMSKTLHTANATICGLRAAGLAQLGFTAAKDILAGDRGLLNALTADNKPEVLTRTLDWKKCALLSNSLKPYACCRHTHSAVYCAELLRGELGSDLEKIVRIVDHTYQVAVDTVDNSAPASAYAFKFSGQFCIAAMLVYGELTDAAFTPEATSDPLVLRVMRRVSLTCDPALEALYQENRNCWAHRLEITLTDGRILTKQVEYPYGDFNNPFSWSYEHKKFRALTDGILTSECADALTDRLMHFEELEDVDRLFQNL